MSWIKQQHPFLISLVAIIVLSICLFKSCTKEPGVITEVKYIPQIDTVYFPHDSIIYKTKVISKEIKDTFYMDNVDTVFVQVPIEHKEYKDTMNTDSTSTSIYVKYHGAFADLDSISLQHQYYNKETTVYTPPRKWGLDFTIGPGVGYGYTPAGWQPWIGISGSIGISRRITK